MKPIFEMLAAYNDWANELPDADDRARRLCLFVRKWILLVGVCR